MPAAAPLLTVADLSQLWVRVPIPEHDLARVDRQQPATVVLHSTDARAPHIPATPVACVAGSTRSPHRRHDLRASSGSTFLARDQMVTVHVPLDGRREECVVPYAAVIFDAYAGTWIYLDQTTDGAAQHVYGTAA